MDRLYFLGRSFYTILYICLRRGPTYWSKKMSSIEDCSKERSATSEEPSVTLEYLRSFRVGGMAVFDWVGTLLGSLLITKALISEPTFIQYLFGFIIVIFISIFVHMAFNVPTMLLYYLGLSEKPARPDRDTRSNA